MGTLRVTAQHAVPSRSPHQLCGSGSTPREHPPPDPCQGYGTLRAERADGGFPEQLLHDLLEGRWLLMMRTTTRDANMMVEIAATTTTNGGTTTARIANVWIPVPPPRKWTSLNNANRMRLSKTIAT